MNKQNKFWITTAIIAVVVIALIVILIPTPQHDTIKIGGMFALTGKWAVGGVTEANFVKLAIDEINANGGVNGKQLELILEDDMCSGNDAVAAANKLIYQDGINVILGPSCTPASAPVAPIANENKVFILAATTTAAGLFDDFEFAFRTSPPSTDAGALIGFVAKKKYNVNNVAIIQEQTEFAQSWADEFTKGLIQEGGKVALKEEYPTGTTDFRGIITKILSADVDGVFLSGQAPEDTALILKQMKELGLVDVKVMGNPTAIDMKIYESIGDALPEDAFTVVPFVENEKLLQKYVDKYGKQPGFQFFYTAAMYDATYMLAEALENCGEDGECVKNYFLNNIKDWRGQVASWTFKKNGDPVLSSDAYKEFSIVNGKKVYKEIEI
ncbi:hypothetical protein DRJ17_02280 [Candidatus Woesearchaeota archaeon]|nr:MAG: hypothetical protein DRJ17_02280 [Candidatus Woesearchaeota archaeon]